MGIAPFDHDFTHLFEIIYPQNRIVVNYDYSGLVHLATIEKSTGKQMPTSFWDLPIRSPKKYDAKALDELAKLDEPNSEGFVVFYPDANLRMKIKFPEYVRLHRIVTGVSEISIWEILKDGGSLKDLIDKVPDEFYQWVKTTALNLANEFDAIVGQARKDMVVLDLNTDDETPRAEKAEFIKNCKYPGIMFKMLDEKDYKEMVWRMIRPHGQSKFKKDIDA